MLPQIKALFCRVFFFMLHLGNQRDFAQRSSALLLKLRSAWCLQLCLCVWVMYFTPLFSWTVSEDSQSYMCQNEKRSERSENETAMGGQLEKVPRCRSQMLNYHRAHSYPKALHWWLGPAPHSCLLVHTHLGAFARELDWCFHQCWKNRTKALVTAGFKCCAITPTCEHFIHSKSQLLCVHWM